MASQLADELLSDLREELQPDSRQFTRRLAAIVHSDLSEGMPSLDISNVSCADIFDEEIATTIFRLEVTGADGARGEVTLRPLPPL